MNAVLKEPSAYTPSEIISIPEDAPERLFSGADDLDKDLFRKLSLQWHPDRSRGDADKEEAFKRLGVLYTRRGEKIKDGTWEGPGQTEIRTTQGKIIRLKYLKKVPFEIGTFYIGKLSVLYLIDECHRPLFDNAMAQIRTFKYATPNMEKEFKRYLPQVISTFEATTGPGVIFEKTSDLIRLRDLWAYVNYKLDPRHVAWVLTRLHNLACYLQWMGLVHNAIDLDTYFVSPEFHSGVLLGGWWYTKPASSPITHLPGHVAQLRKDSLPPGVLQQKVAVPLLDHELIRAVARTLLGDPGGSKLLRDPDVPQAMAQWVTLPGNADAFKDFSEWEKARERSYAVRKFTVLDVSPQDVYGPGI